MVVGSLSDTSDRLVVIVFNICVIFFVFTRLSFQLFVLESFEEFVVESSSDASDA